MQHDNEALTRIAFGSCRKQKLPQPVWDAVAATAPELWLWTGDAIYPEWPTTPELLKAAYEIAEAHSGHRAMLVIKGRAATARRFLDKVPQLQRKLEAQAKTVSFVDTPAKASTHAVTATATAVAATAVVAGAVALALRALTQQ